MWFLWGQCYSCIYEHRLRRDESKPWTNSKQRSALSIASVKSWCHQKATSSTGDVARWENVNLAYTKPCFGSTELRRESTCILWFSRLKQIQMGKQTKLTIAFIAKRNGKSMALKIPGQPDFSMLLWAVDITWVPVEFSPRSVGC